MTLRNSDELGIRLFFFVYYGIVWGLAIHRYVSVVVRRELLGKMDSPQIVMFALLVVISWWFIKALRRGSDRLAALLYGLFYAIRIGTQFAKHIEVPILIATDCIIISIGMIAMIIGLIRTIVQNSHPSNTTSSF